MKQILTPIIVCFVAIAAMAQTDMMRITQKSIKTNPKNELINIFSIRISKIPLIIIQVHIFLTKARMTKMPEMLTDRWHLQCRQVVRVEWFLTAL